MIRTRGGYTLLLYFLLPFVLLRLLWRARKQPGYLRHIPERFGRYRIKGAQTKPVLWLHAVSVGETRACAPLISSLKARYPEHQILLTHMTPTGRETGVQLFGEGVLRCYLPYDLPFAVRRFLAYFKPALGMLMETEIWMNLIHSCHEQKIPLALINARLSAKSAAGYARHGALVSEAMSKLAAVSAQTTDDAQRLEKLGAANVTVCGNLKFDVPIPSQMIELGARLRESFGVDRPVWLAASTRDGEEALLLDHLDAIAAPGALCVLVPRHPQRFADVAALLRSRRIPFQRRSEQRPIEAATRIVLGDSMGEMLAYYAACDVAFVAGSLLPLGGQNLIEACAVGKAVLVGPHMRNFAEATRLAVESKAAIQVADADELASEVTRLLQDATARQAMRRAALDFARQGKGATQCVLQLVAKLVPSQ
jgi:3-deoxy-D-manno-octulosonic-acid transferase